MRYWIQLATEQFPPSALVRQAQEAESAGFDALNVSDHFQPWWEPGESGHAWALLGAIGQATSKLGVGTGVTAPVFRHNPAVVAQFAATMEELCPRRAYLGIGSGESLNESPCGMDWPPVPEQVERMDEALDIINRLLDGERLDHHGHFYRTKAAYLHTRGERRPPLYVSAFGPRAAAVAAHRGDGLWTLADPEQAPEIIDAYRGACEDAGREPGEIILQAGFSWAEDDDSALEGARVWKSTQIPDVFHRRLARPARDVRARGEGDLRRRLQGGLHRVVRSRRARRAGPRGRAARRDRRLPAERVRLGTRAGAARVRRAGAARPSLSAGLSS